MTETKSPRFLPTTKTFRSGYGARAITLSRDQKTLFVGCKDGSVTVVDLVKACDDGLTEERAPKFHPTDRASIGLRWIYDLRDQGSRLTEGDLLLGDDLGKLIRLQWGEDRKSTGEWTDVADCPGDGAEAGKGSPVTFVDDWDGAHLLVSYRDRNALLFPNDPFLEPLSKERMTEFPVLKDVQGVCGMMRHSGKDTLLICENGALWQVRQDLSWIDLLEKCCEEPEQPGFVSDTMRVSLNSSSGHPGQGDGQEEREALYLATDMGLYLLRWDGDQAKVRKVHLPGIPGMCMAVSYVKKEGCHFLWVSDLAGDVHMFWREVEEESEAPLYWQRFGFRLDSSKAVRSIASFGPCDTIDFTICQACRDEKVVVTSYKPEPRDRGNASYVLAWGTLGEFKDWPGPIDYPDWTKWHPDWENWCLEARFAALIEEVGREHGQFAHFLSSPQPEQLAWEILRQEIGSVERGRQAIVLWTDALLGTVHRRLEERREQQSLGVVRWLRRLAERCRKSQGDEEWMGALLGYIEGCIRHARKWGVFGDTYAERKEVFGPLAALEAQKVGDRQLDSIAYRTLLFGRRLDVEDEKEKPESPRQRRIPWDVQYLSDNEEADGGRGWIAVSWGGGGIDVYRVESQSQEGSSSVAQLESVPDLKIPDAGDPEREHSRSVVLDFLTPDRKRPYLLYSPARAAGPRDSWKMGEPNPPESLRITFFDPESGCAEPTLEAPLPPGESVYSLLKLPDGVVLMGLKGGEGSARLAVARVEPGGVRLLADKKHPERNFLELPAAYPELNHIKLNPVWSLARTGDTVLGQSFEEGFDFIAVAGCGDGQIWQVQLRVHLAEGTFSLKETVLVGRLGTPVRALAVPWRNDEDPERIVAGGADGTVLAYQKIDDVYVTLWATREEGVISRLHAFQADLSDRTVTAEGSGTHSLILAVTQAGIGVLISDRKRVQEVRTDRAWEEAPHRLHIPGERLGRLSLGSTAFGSALLQKADAVDRETEGRVARMAVASSEGVLRLLTLHYPKYTELRQSQFRKIRNAWMEILRGGESVMEGVLGHRLYRAEALYAAVPHLSAVMVRWILWPDQGLTENPKPWSERETIRAEAPGPIRQWMPRHLQPLIDLDDAWAGLQSAPSETERDNLAVRLSESFTEALKAARDVRDSRLFKEILEVTLNRANHQLFREMRKVTHALRNGQGPEKIHTEWFISLLNCLIDIKGAWLGAPRGIDTRMRVVIVRNLVDGDTLWSLSEALSEALRHAKESLRKEIEWITAKRIQQIHEFLAKGDPLLSLEVLRAVNLSMARACRRLGPNDELASGIIEGYYETVGDFASRAVHSARNDLGEALAHEICRTYALGMLACSSSTLRLTHRMSEADLPNEFARQTYDQFSLLSRTLERPMPKGRLQIFQIGSGQEAGSGKPDPQSLLSRRDWDNERDENNLGKDNETLIEEGRTFDEIVDWLYDLAERFENRPESVDLKQGFIYLEQFDETRRYEAFRHSLTFWKGALKQFCAVCEESGFSRFSTQAASENVRPDLVLVSKDLSEWCKTQQSELDKMKDAYKIFDPQRNLYSQVLAALRKATEDFRKGVSLQKNIVQGVLSHGLLEMLDEHLLGLWEVAQALDPEQTWKREDEDTRVDHSQRRSRAARFADAMLTTAFKAEVIPKNLRNLQWLLSYDSKGAVLKSSSTPGTQDGMKAGQELVPLSELLQDFTDDDYGWNIKGAQSVPLELRESHFLRFVLNELADNQGHNPTGLGAPIVTVEAPPYKEGEFQPCNIFLTFYCDPLKKVRILELQEKKLQQPIQPDANSRMRSHGMGLYLANLAAGAVGWKLSIEKYGPENPERIPFVLTRRRTNDAALATDRG